MTVNFKSYARLEPRPGERNFEAGFAAPVHDPLWLLARQWQLGELQGENASSPVFAAYRLASALVVAPDPELDPRYTPPEVLVESELDDWWTMGRRVRIGRLLAEHPAVQGQAALRFHDPPPPYEAFHGRPDGLAIWRARAALGLADDDFGAEHPPRESRPAWDTEQLLYDQRGRDAFSTATHRLEVRRHRGGRLDWYGVDASPAGEGDPAGAAHTTIPAALEYPGAPRSRWWEIEDAEVDPAGYAPDSAHTATAILTDLLLTHADDWFVLPITGEAGHVVRVEGLEIEDAFGRTYAAADWPGLRPPEAWTLFQVAGLPEGALLLWQVAELPLEGPVVERVLLGKDEQANLVWAVERVLGGRDVEARLPQPGAEVPSAGVAPAGDARRPQAYRYVPGEGITRYWHPYAIEDTPAGRRFVQHRLSDLSRAQPAPMPPPEALALLAGDPGAPTLHLVTPSAVPSNGLAVERRWMLARDQRGAPLLWTQCQRRPLLASPARRLRFDVMARE